ncbi:hypothetical protein H6503_06000 [Candidatus Woesearchaeota archaeon]|nr:hypothetical protein [Candidatus Woesearchaeota archaeon]
MNRFEEIEKFKAEKDKILSKEDMSRKGAIDKEIRELVDEINSKDIFCTTSSCAGRITLLERRSNKKIDSKWIFSSHQPVKAKDIWSNLKECDTESDVWLMQESCILHVFARTFEAADKFLKACHKVGFKRSGITSLSGKIMIEMMGNEKVEALMIKKGKILIDEAYVNIIIEESNSRMLKNREKMDKFLDEIRIIG